MEVSAAVCAAKETIQSSTTTRHVMRPFVKILGLLTVKCFQALYSAKCNKESTTTATTTATYYYCCCYYYYYYYY